MTGKVLASAVLGLALLCACGSETKDPVFDRTGPLPRTGPGSSTLPNTGTPTSPGGPITPAMPGNFGSNPDGLAQIAGTGSFGASGSGASKTETCGATDITNGRVQPKVWLVIDGSGSMADPLMAPADPQMPVAGPSRWDSLRQALMDPNGGVVPTLEKLVQFGMVMYDGPLGGGIGTTQTLPDGGPATGMPPTDECPRLAT
ncbi:MAG TPA: hypothetical protein VJR89_02280, partial [Polyangiales bacterium]|nr:hypothetical protein [Polyangiales bacterium]